MTTSPSETIAKALEGVTPGPWEAKQNAYGAAFIYGGETLTTSVGTEYKELVAGGNSHDTLKVENATYIAACNPVAMREVLDELYALRETALQFEAMKRETAEKDERIAALEAGLKPFAAHQTADGLSGPGSLLHIPDDHPLLFNGLGNDLRVTVTVGDVRRARTLIQGEKQ